MNNLPIAKHPSCKGCGLVVKIDNKDYCFCLSSLYDNNRKCPFRQTEREMLNGLLNGFTHSPYVNFNKYLQMLNENLNTKFFDKFKRFNKI